MFFDARRYDLARVGRYKFNKKLHLKNRVVGKELLEDAVDPNTGEILAESGTVITRELATEIQDAGIPYVMVKGTSTPERALKVLSNLMVDIRNYVDMENPTEYGIVEPVYYPALMEVLKEAEENKVDVKKYVKRHVDRLIPKHITKEDIFASINYNMQIEEGIGSTDDIDPLGNPRRNRGGEGTACTMSMHRIIFRACPSTDATIFSESIIRCIFTDVTTFNDNYLRS